MISTVQPLMVEVDTEGYADYQQRSDRMGILKAYLGSKRASEIIKFSNFQSVLSIGSGEGLIDDYILTKCPNVKEFVGLEPHTERCDEARTLISTKHPNIEVKLLEESFEDYKPGEKRYDAVLLIHSIYFFINDLKPTMDKALALTREGGQVIVILNDVQVMTECDAKVRGYDGEVTSILGEFQAAIKGLESEYDIVEEDMKHPVAIDLEDAGTGHFDCLQLFLNKPMTVEEKSKVVNYLKDYTRPGTNLYDLHLYIFAFTKK